MTLTAPEGCPRLPIQQNHMLILRICPDFLIADPRPQSSGSDSEIFVILKGMNSIPISGIKT